MLPESPYKKILEANDIAVGPSVRNQVHELLKPLMSFRGSYAKEVLASSLV